MKETRYCERCEKETVHDVDIERDANDPTEEFIEAEEEGYASNADCSFYSNGDSEWRVICSVCFCSYTEL